MIIIYEPAQLVGRSSNSLLPASIGRCFFDRLIIRLLPPWPLLKHEAAVSLCSMIGPDPTDAVNRLDVEDRHVCGETGEWCEN